MSEVMTERQLNRINYIGLHVRHPNANRWAQKFYGVVTELVHIIPAPWYRGEQLIRINTTHSRGVDVRGRKRSGRFGEYIGGRYGVKIYLDKKWRRSCPTCAYNCKRGKVCPMHSDNTIKEGT